MSSCASIKSILSFISKLHRAALYSRRPPLSSPPILSRASIMTIELPRMTHMPRRTFSLFAFDSVASSSTTFRNTCVLRQPSLLEHRARLESQHVTYVVAAQRAHYLTRAIELDFDALVKVLQFPLVGSQGGANDTMTVCPPSSTLAVLEASWT
jgi:hypothetical protein